MLALTAPVLSAYLVAEYVGTSWMIRGCTDDCRSNFKVRLGRWGDLSLDPPITYAKMCGMGVCLYNISAGEVETGSFLELACSQSSLIAEFQVH